MSVDLIGLEDFVILSFIAKVLMSQDIRPKYIIINPKLFKQTPRSVVGVLFIESELIPLSKFIQAF